jgi:hypothetical protein
MPTRRALEVRDVVNDVREAPRPHERFALDEPAGELRRGRQPAWGTEQLEPQSVRIRDDADAAGRQALFRKAASHRGAVVRTQERAVVIDERTRLPRWTPDRA